MPKIANKNRDNFADSDVTRKGNGDSIETTPAKGRPARRKKKSGRAGGRGKRVRVAEGIFRDRYGLSATVKANGIQREVRFPPGTSLMTIRARRDEMRASLRTLPKGVKHTLADDARRYLDKMKGRIVSFDNRRRHVMRWVEKFGHLRTLMLAHHIPELNDYLHELHRTLSAATCNLHRDAIMNLVRVLYGNQAASGLSDLHLFRKEPPKPRSVSRSHMQDVLAQLEPDDVWTLRLHMMYWTGMRATQIGRLQREHFVFDAQAPYVVVPQAKECEQTAVPLVLEGLAVAKKFVDMDAFGPCDPAKANRRLTQAAERAGRPKFTTYAFRHSFAADLRRTGTDLADIASMYGHLNRKTTETYAPADMEKNAASIKRMVTVLDKKE